MIEKANLILAQLNERETLQSLSPRHTWNHKLEESIEALNVPKQADPHIIALLTGLHLLNDSIDVAHAYAQQIEHEATGAYWHGIIHRMEGDYANAQYWFMRVGEHPVMAVIKQRTSAWLKAEVDVESIAEKRMRDTLLKYREDAGWDARTFVDLVALQESSAAHKSEETRHILEQIQHIEVTELFNYTLQAAEMAAE